MTCPIQSGLASKVRDKYLLLNGRTLLLPHSRIGQKFEERNEGIDLAIVEPRPLPQFAIVGQPASRTWTCAGGARDFTAILISDQGPGSRGPIDCVRHGSPMRSVHGGRCPLERVIVIVNSVGRSREPRAFLASEAKACSTSESITID